MKDIVVITPGDAGNGFACCGVRQCVASPGEASLIVSQVLDDPESGVVILDERLLAEVGEERLQAMEEQWPGVLVVMPAPRGEDVAEDYAMRLIRRAIGYQIRVRT